MVVVVVGVGGVAAGGGAVGWRVWGGRGLVLRLVAGMVTRGG